MTIAPADIEQRDGRIVRQGNQNAQVQVYRYVVEQSFDAYSWQTVERKAKFIAQVMRGRADARSVGDIGDSALSFAEVKALASGDPLILEHARATNDLARLTRLERAWQRNRQSLRTRLTAAELRADARGRDVQTIAAAIPNTIDTAGERFAMTLANGQTITSRTGAGERLTTILRSLEVGRPQPLGRLGGHLISGQRRRDQAHRYELVAWLDGIPRQDSAHATEDVAMVTPLSLIRQIEHRVSDLPALLERVSAEQQAAAQEAATARTSVDEPFKHQVELDAARTAVTELVEQMTGASCDPADQDAPASEPTQLEPGAATRPDVDPSGTPAHHAPWREPPTATEGLTR